MDIIFELIDLLERAREALYQPLGFVERAELEKELNEMLSRLTAPGG